MSYKEHAQLEFQAAGWTNEDGKFDDDMQELLCTQVLELLDLFSEHGHSGSTAPYAIKLFTKLAKFEPISPLTGEDWEWTKLDYDNDVTYQNKRHSSVFKDADGRAYDIDGKIFWEWVEYELEPDEQGYPGTRKYKSYFTNRDSRVYIDFPYTPTREYVEISRSI